MKVLVSNLGADRRARDYPSPRRRRRDKIKTEDIRNSIVQGDCLGVLRRLHADTADLVCTDPPYGYSFMRNDWDKAVPSTEIWKECFRILKPGAFAFIMSAPRADVLSHMLTRIGDAGFRIDFTPLFWTYATGFPKATNIAKSANKFPALRQLAFTFDGAYGGFQPKPAVEVIIVAMKPLSERNYLKQAVKNRKGITWLDDGRIPYDAEDKPKGGFGGMDSGIGKPLEHQEYRGAQEANSRGRFPANLLVSNDVMNVGKIQDNKPTSGDMANRESGSFSRYFDLDKWAQKTIPFLVVPKASKKEKGGDNDHPTVKPLKLMSYLITLGSRPGDLVVDPFAGSGTTAIAASQLGRDYIGIEKEPRYARTARARLDKERIELSVCGPGSKVRHSVFPNGCSDGVASRSGAR